MDNGTGPHRPERDPGLERLVLLSDGVFAIAITLLAIELHLPETAEHKERGELLRAIGGTWPQILAFVQSFTILALYWAAHHRLFLRIVRADGGLVMLNLAFLLTVAFQPFPTAIVGEHFADPAAALLYFATLIATNTVLWGIWHYVTAPHRRLCPRISPRLVRHYHVIFILPTVAFLVLSLLSLWDLATPSGRVPFRLGVGVAYLIAAAFFVLVIQEFREPD